MLSLRLAYDWYTVGRLVDAFVKAVIILHTPLPNEHRAFIE